MTSDKKLIDEEAALAPEINMLDIKVEEKTSKEVIAAQIDQLIEKAEVPDDLKQLGKEQPLLIDQLGLIAFEIW